MNVVIVGNGIAGNEVAFTLRKHDENINITILSAETFPEYDPCSLPYFVGGDVGRDVVFRKCAEHYERHRIGLVTGEKVVAVGSSSRTVVTESGNTYPYDRLVLAYGARSVVPPIPGVDREGVLGCKELAEADRLAGLTGSRAVVVGSGAIGIETAEALTKKGYEVYIIELLDWIMPTMFDEPAARRLEKSLAAGGIHVLTGEKVTAVEGDQWVTGVVTDKRRIDCDLVVMAAGVAPAPALARSAGIDVGRGIKVDAAMQTSIPGIYACGDCVETADCFSGEDSLYMLKHNALDQATVVAMNILGRETSYPGAYMFSKIHFFDTYAATCGKTMKTAMRTAMNTATANHPDHLENRADDIEIIQRETEDAYLRVLLRGDRIIGAQAIGEFACHIGLLMGAMWRGDDMARLREEYRIVGGVDSPGRRLSRRIAGLLGFQAR